LESIIAKDAIKSNSYPSLDFISSHKFFDEFASSFKKNFIDIASEKPNLNATLKDSIAKAVHKTESRLKDEQKLVM